MRASDDDHFPMMSEDAAECVLEIAAVGPSDRARSVETWVSNDVARAIADAPGLSHADAYRLADAEARDPFVDDGAGPLALIIACFRDEVDLGRILAAQWCDRLIAAAPVGVVVTATAMRRARYPLADGTMGSIGDAPFSYVVRYHRPADDEARFVAEYAATHPPLIARLERVRAIACYFPIGGTRARNIAPADYMIGNEAVFDSLEDFNAAMASPARRELRAHYHSLPPFSGRVTHYPMLRRRILG